jgi:hypothetical protein
MPGVPRELIEHELHLDPKAKLVKQQLHHFTQDKKDVIKKEIARLLDTDFIKEVYHLDWLANPVLVPKKNKDWRMCVDYTNLNKAHKKDPFGLPWIDQVTTPQPVVVFYVSSTAILGIIRFPKRKNTKSRCPSSLCLVHFVIQLCPSGKKARVQLTNGVYNGVCIHCLGVMRKRMLTTWS